ncbi:hypothetical protein [Hymenobacter ruber]
MKIIRTVLCAMLVGGAGLAAAPAAQAQINININPPSWGPAVPQGSQYYYIPETDGFYDVPARQYVVRRNGKWLRTGTLSGYNTANFHPVVVDYVGAEPWSRYDEYRGKYAKPGGNPHGLSPGQAKKMYRNDDHHDGDHHDDDHGKGHGKGKGKH